jgi:hypothetical protein
VISCFFLTQVDKLLNALRSIQWFPSCWTPQKCLSDKRFGRDSSLKQSLTFWLQKPNTLFFISGVQDVVPWWEECVHVIGDCAIYTSMSEYISRHQTVYLTYWTPLCLPYVISIQEYTRPVNMNIHLEACSQPLFIMIASDTLNHSLKFHQLFLYNMQMKQGSVGLYCLVWNWILAI